jgi:transposase-like protein
MRPADQIDVPRADQEELRRWLRSGMARKRLAQRVRIVLMSTKPISAAKIADQLGIVRLTVYKWRSRYRESGLEGLKDRSRPGRPLKKRPPVDAAAVAASPAPNLEPPASSRPPS